MKTFLVTDVHGDQIQVDGQWYHAERIFSRAASEYAIGDLEPKLQEPVATPVTKEPDEWVSCDLFRESGANVTSPEKIAEFRDAMRAADGWGSFPMVTGRIETVTMDDIGQCSSLALKGKEHVWLGELAWSRLITLRDLGRRYVHLENGHHRMHAGKALIKDGLRIRAPVFDLNREEESARFYGTTKSTIADVSPALPRGKKLSP